MDVQEAVVRVHELRERKKVLEAVQDFLRTFLAIEDEFEAVNVLWMEDGGKVSQETLRQMSVELTEQMAELDEELRHLFGMDVEVQDDRQGEEAEG